MNAKSIFVQLDDEEIVRLIAELHRSGGASTITANDGTKVVLINVSED